MVRLLSQRSTRLKLCEQSLFWFGFHYFPHYFTHQTPEFHYEMTKGLQFSDPTVNFFLLEAFKDSAKTSWARIELVRRICFKLIHFGIYACHDHGKAKSNLFDVAIELQTNEKILNDFGQLFYEPTLEETGVKKSKKKSIDEFITANGIKIKAYSTAMSTRGELHINFRPDFYILDDFENDKTKRSVPRTEEVKTFIDELLTGVSAYALIIFLANKISNKGSVNYLEQKAAQKKNFRIMEVPLIKNGVIAWPSRFVWTDQQALEINNKCEKKEQYVFSIETKKSDIGTRRFNQEYLLIPIPLEDVIIKKEWVENNYYHELPKDRGNMKGVIMLDPQSGEKQSADFFSICIVAFFKNDRHRYVVSSIKGKASQLAQAALLIKTYQQNKHWCLIAGVEKVMNQTAVYQNILDWISGKIDLEKFGVNDKDRNIPIIAVDPNRLDKVSRLQLQEASFERNEIHLHATMRTLTDQLLAFPDIEHDDDVDALIYCLEQANIRNNFTTESSPVYNDSKTLAGNTYSEKF